MQCFEHHFRDLGRVDGQLHLHGGILFELIGAGIDELHPDWTVTLEGHTDSIGSAAANRLLSERRVTSVRARLMGNHRVDGARLKTAGYGSARPRETNATIEGRARNRRVELGRECARQ